MGIGEATNVTTEKARLSYVHLFKPYAAMQGQEEKFSVTRRRMWKQWPGSMQRLKPRNKRGLQKNGMGRALQSYRLRFTMEMESGQVTACRSEKNVKVIGCLPQVRR